MRRRQNIQDYEYALGLNLSLWNAREQDKSAVDLGTSWGEAACKAAKHIATSKVINARAFIDNRDPARSPVFVHDNIERSEFDLLMKSLRARGIEKAGDLPKGFIIVLDLPGPGKSVLVDETGEQIMQTRFAKLVQHSPWNTAMQEELKRSWIDRLKDMAPDIC